MDAKSENKGNQIYANKCDELKQEINKILSNSSENDLRIILKFLKKLTQK